MSTLAWNNVVSTLHQRWETLFQRCVTLFQRPGRCINVVQRWKTDVGFCFIFNVGSMLFQRWSTTLKQRWSNVEMLAGLLLSSAIRIKSSSVKMSLKHSIGSWGVNEPDHGIPVKGKSLITTRPGSVVSHFSFELLCCPLLLEG